MVAKVYILADNWGYDGYRVRKVFSLKESAIEEVKKIIGKDSFYWCKIDSDFDSLWQWQDNKTEKTHILEIEEFELE